MKKLNERQRAFVVAMLEFGGTDNTKAARAAGYSDSGGSSIRAQAYRLAHNDDILSAIKEEGQKRLSSSSIMAVNNLLDIANDMGTEKKDRLKAIEMILNRTGFHATSEHKVAVTHKDETTDDQVKRLTVLAKTMGIDPQRLLGTLVTDAEYVEVEDSIADLL